MDTSNNQEQKKIKFTNKKFIITSLLQSGNNSATSINALFIRHSGVLQPKMATFGQQYNIHKRLRAIRHYEQVR